MAELLDRQVLTAQFRKFVLRRPATFIAESAPCSRRRLKRKHPWLYYHLTLRWLQVWRRHLGASTFLVSFPKSGRTWLRTMVEYAVEREYGAAAKQGLWSFVHDDDPFWRRPAELASRKTEFRYKRVILLTREPKDVLVSSFFHKRDRQGLWTGSLQEYLAQPIGGLETWVRYHEIWRAHAQEPLAFMEISYEELHADAVGQLQRVLAFLGRPVPDETLAEAVRHASFERMQARERESCGADARAESLKARKGLVGGHRDYLSPDEIAALDERIARGS